MNKVISILVDSHHIFNPTVLKDSDHYDTTWLDRVFGAFLLLLTVPLTLGVGTGFYIYFAYRKVVKVEELRNEDVKIQVIAKEKLLDAGCKGKTGETVYKPFVEAKRAIKNNDYIEFTVAFESLNKLFLNRQEAEEEYKNLLVQLCDDAVERDCPEILKKISDESPIDFKLPLHKAVSQKMVEMMVEQYDQEDRPSFINWFYFDEDRNTALHYQQNLEVVSALIDAEAVFMENKRGITPLHCCKEPAVAKLLIKHFGKHIVEYEDKDGNTALHYQQNLEVVGALLDAGAKFKANKRGFTPLHCCEDPEIAKLLIKCRGKDIIESKDKYGQTPLFEAPEAVQHVLLENGADATVEDNKGYQPLYYVQSVDVAKAFINKGAKSDAKFKKNRTALFGYISPEVAKWLVEDCKLSVEHKDADGFEPIHYLENKDSDFELAKVLIGDRKKDHQWDKKKPRIFENARFKKWLTTAPRNN